MDASRVANWIFACAVSSEDRESVLGDLTEEFALRRAETSRLTATMWYWAQVGRSMPWLLCTPIRRNGWLRTSGVAIAACVVQAAVEVATAVLMLGTLPSLMLVLLSLGVISCVANLYRPGAGTIIFAVTLTSVLARGIVAGPAHLLLALCAPSASFAGAALAVNAHRRPKAE